MNYGLLMPYGLLTIESIKILSFLSMWKGKLPTSLLSKHKNVPVLFSSFSNFNFQTSWTSYCSIFGHALICIMTTINLPKHWKKHLYFTSSPDCILFNLWSLEDSLHKLFLFIFCLVVVGKQSFHISFLRSLIYLDFRQLLFYFCFFVPKNFSLQLLLPSQFPFFTKVCPLKLRTFIILIQTPV